MEHKDAVALIQQGIGAPGQSWADLGAGSGTFSLALADLLGEKGQVYSVDRQVKAFSPNVVKPSFANIIPLQADFTQTLDLPPLDGILMANALHFVAQKQHVLRKILSLLKPNGVLLLVEYDTARSNPWVPYPIPMVAFPQLAAVLELTPPIEIGRRPSRYGNGDIYAALCKKR